MQGQSGSHRDEVRRGERFEFGKNWTRFLRVLNDDRISLAEKSLATMLKRERLDGLTFLDIGSGSGLFSLAARRLGANVHSFDYDSSSVACACELKRRYFLNDPNWRIEQASVLDKTYLEKLGAFDIVYSWGVLHHTGMMWQALDNVKPLVKMGGELFIAIYNDMGAVTDRWAEVKRTYNSLSAPLARLYALRIIAAEEKCALRGYLGNGGVFAWLRSWSEYDKQSTRGMSKWHDWIDWIGGHPYERATIEQMVDHYSKDGFRLVNLFDCSHGYGCNEFVFVRAAPLGAGIDSPIPGGRSLVRRFGRRVLAPVVERGEGIFGSLSQFQDCAAEGRLWLFGNGVLVGPAELDPQGRVKLSADADDESVFDQTFHVVAGQLRKPDRPFVHSRGFMWAWEAADLEAQANSADNGSRSTVFVLQDGRHLDYPNAMHADIARTGDGRFSHWGGYVYFAPRGNVDPNSTAESFALFIPGHN